MPPSDRPGRRDPVFGDGGEAQRGQGRGPRFTMDDDDSADRARGGLGDMRAEARDDATWRARSRDYDDLYEEPRGGPPYFIIGAVVAVLAVAGAAWFTYNRSGDRAAGGALPLIRADGGPTKIAPDQPGGVAVPNQDKLVYNRLAGERSPDAGKPGAEELLPPPEEPRRVPAPAAAAPSGPSSASTVSPAAPVGAVQVAGPPAAAAPGLSQAELAARVREQSGGPVEISGDRTPKGAPNANDNTPPPPPRQAGSLEAPKGMTAIRPTGEAATLLAEPAEVKPTPAAKGVTPPTAKPAPLAPAAVAPAAPASASAAPAHGGNAVVQLGALPDEDMVDREWERLVKKHGDLLTGLKKVVIEVEVPGKGTLYRLRAGGLKDAKAAQDLCAKLKARNQPCLVP